MSIILSPALTRTPRVYLNFNSATIMSFEAICNEIEQEADCTYVSYALELNNLKRVHYYSNKNWNSIFVKEKLIDDCPLMIYGQKNKNATILNWRDITANMDKKQRRVMDARKEHNIGNGICLQQNIYGLKEIITLASDFQNIDFPQQVFSNLIVFKNYVRQFRTIALASMLSQKWFNPSILKCFNLTTNFTSQIFH